MHRDSNLLFAVFAVQLKKVPAGALMEVAAAWAGDPSRDLPDRLVESGALSESDRRLIQDLVNTAITAHNGDATQALHSFGGDDQVNQTFHGTFHRTDSGVEFEDRSGAAFDVDVSIHEIPGRYKEISEHGRGGMGKVLLVHDEALGRDIVLKELLPLPSEPGKTTPARKSASMIARFLQEAKITGQLEHPAIAPVYELGYRFDGSLYYTMKLVRGRTLSQAFAEAKSLRQRLELLPHFIDLCQALAYAHSRGVIHRDLKPANIMLGEFGETVILDWGLAKLRDKPDVHADELERTIQSWHLGESADTDKTAPGEILGTPLYMAPEQARGKIDEVDHRTDIYALGVMLYQLLTGQTPFPWTNVQDVLNRVANDTPPPIRSIAPNAPPELAAIAHRALAHNPRDRYQSAKALAQDLRSFQSGALVQAHDYTFYQHFKRFSARHKAILSTSAAALLALLALGTYSYLNIREARDLAEQKSRETQAALDREQKQREATEVQRTAATEARGKGELLGYESHIGLANAALAQENATEALRVLSESPVSLRNWEWDYLTALCRRKKTSYLPNEEFFGRLLLSESEDGYISAVHLAENAIWRAPSMHHLSVWNLSERTVFTIPPVLGSTNQLTAGEFLPSHGMMVFTSTFARYSGEPDSSLSPSPIGIHRLWLWNCRTNSLVASRDFSIPFKYVLFLDEARQIVAISDDTLVLLSTPSLSTQREMPIHEFRLTEITRLGHSSTIIGKSGDDFLIRWDVAAADTPEHVEDASADITAVCSDSDGLVFACARNDGTITLWNAATNQKVAAFGKSTETITGLDFSPSGTRILATNASGGLKLYDCKSGLLLAEELKTEPAAKEAFKNFDNGPRATFALGDSLAIAGSTLIKFDDYTAVPRVLNFGTPIQALDMSSDGSRVLVRGTVVPYVEVYDATTLTILARLECGQALQSAAIDSSESKSEGFEIRNAFFVEGRPDEVFVVYREMIQRWSISDAKLLNWILPIARSDKSAYVNTVGYSIPDNCSVFWSIDRNEGELLLKAEGLDRTEDLPGQRDALLLKKARWFKQSLMDGELQSFPLPSSSTCIGIDSSAGKLLVREGPSISVWDIGDLERELSVPMSETGFWEDEFMPLMNAHPFLVAPDKSWYLINGRIFGSDGAWKATIEELDEQHLFLNPPIGLTASADGIRIAVLAGPLLRLFDAESGRQLLELPANAANTLDSPYADSSSYEIFGPDGDTLVSISDGAALFWRRSALQTSSGPTLESVSFDALRNRAIEDHFKRIVASAITGAKQAPSATSEEFRYLNKRASLADRIAIDGLVSAIDNMQQALASAEGSEKCVELTPVGIRVIDPRQLLPLELKKGDIICQTARYVLAVPDTINEAFDTIREYLTQPTWEHQQISFLIYRDGNVFEHDFFTSQEDARRMELIRLIRFVTAITRW